jgi:hypothetical protein
MTTFSADDPEPDDLHAAREEIRLLKRALSSRPVIDQAKGMLMARHGCTADEAFGMLAAASQRSNRPVSELARSIVEHACGGRSPRVSGPSDRPGALHAVDLDPVDLDLADLDSMLAEALTRDQRAERRDRDAEARDLVAERRCPDGPDEAAAAVMDRAQAAIDRLLSGADRDASAGDRAELLRWRERLRSGQTAPGAPDRRPVPPERP